jgi:IPT/TIG domain
VLPYITSFKPTSGPAGTSVVITGVSITQTSKVTFGGVKAATVTVNSDTQVTATVPTGAKTGKIVIATAGGSATSSGTFTVTP